MTNSVVNHTLLFEFIVVVVVRRGTGVSYAQGTHRTDSRTTSSYTTITTGYSSFPRVLARYGRVTLRPITRSSAVAESKRRRKFDSAAMPT